MFLNELSLSKQHANKVKFSSCDGTSYTDHKWYHFVLNISHSGSLRRYFSSYYVLQIEQQHEYTRYVGLFGTKMMRINELIDGRKRLDKNTAGVVTGSEANVRWAQSVLDTGDDGMPSLLYNFHAMLRGTGGFQMPKVGRNTVKPLDRHCPKINQRFA